MNALMSTSPRVDLRGLIDAIAQASADDAMTNPLSPAQWEVVAPYLQPTVFPASHTVFSQGAQDRTLYLVESGTLSVHYQDEKERLRLAVVGPGSVVGEGAFFSHRPRSATVQTSAPSKLWALHALRFTELANRQPAVALALTMAVGSVLAKRLGNRKRRVAATLHYRR